jgi:hypothetical protein
MRALRAVSAIFAAAAGFDAEQTAPLHFLAAPMCEMNLAALGDQVEQRLTIERKQLFEFHCDAATLIPNFENRNPKISLSWS